MSDGAIRVVEWLFSQLDEKLTKQPNVILFMHAYGNGKSEYE